MGQNGPIVLNEWHSTTEATLTPYVVRMTRLKQTAATIGATLIVAAGCHLSAFEQGTYFIYQIVDQDEAQPIDKRLTVNREFFVAVGKAQATVEPAATDRSEFEMDYNSFGTTNDSAFDAPSQASNETSAAVSESSAFNLGTQNDFSSFGN
jgi:hypothetical protein